MTAFKTPVLAKLSIKFERAQAELANVNSRLSKNRSDIEGGDWVAVSALAHGIHNVYNGIEDIMLAVAKDGDDAVPSGASVQQDVIDQFASPIAGVRAEIIGHDLHAALTELKGFRHVVRHKYGFDLMPKKVIENAENAIITLPRFIEAVTQLDEKLTPREEPDEDVSNQPRP